MESKITLPRARRADVDSEMDRILSLVRLSPVPESDEALRLSVVRCRENIFVIDDTSGPVAVVAFSLPYWDGAMMIDHLAVAPAYRRQGLASMLYAHAEHVARELGVRRVCFPVPAGVSEAMSFCMSQGFQMQSIFPAYFGATTGLVWLDKELS